PQCPHQATGKNPTTSTWKPYQAELQDFSTHNVWLACRCAAVANTWFRGPKPDGLPGVSTYWLPAAPYLAQRIHHSVSAVGPATPPAPAPRMRLVVKTTVNCRGGRISIFPGQVVK
ncbi:unnamed protein product, partial [Ectocarpus fasciculatus]